MTRSQESPVTRETSARYKKRPLIVTVEGYVITMREKGRRDRVEVPIDAIYDLGLKMRARSLRVEKLLGKKGRA
jgi:hypothetical protein